MTRCLIGHSGFVGSTLLKQTRFDFLYRSINIGEINGKTFEMAVCAGAPAQKWIVNREPEADLQKINGLIARLKTIECKTFILISTVDVFKNSIDVDENTTVEERGLHAYGLHRRLLEKFVKNHFPNHLIIRLPGLVGPGLRKNVIFDFLNNNNLHAIESRGIFQFYPIVNLWYDIQTILDAGIQLIHFTAAPISVADVSLHGFGKPFEQQLAGTPAWYNMRTRYAAAFGVQRPYQYSIRETIQAIRAYAQSEPVTLKTTSETTT
uniref:Nucleoside-diphosphate-sugar epimerase n=1 Tax=Candidatus Kentrum sp. LFY TaxID=2126342 RepID=A0A450V220_9GAMM|nr:MAG: Nucleoside-diphosphate-sugar epimerase [Candidatus Kentron sp. LFY]